MLVIPTRGTIRGPYPSVVFVTGSIQSAAGVYEWLAEDLAERGYVVLTFDVQGQGQSETLPHNGTLDGVPSEQQSNFDNDAENAISWMLSTPARPWRRSYNPLWAEIDHRPDRQSVTPGRQVPLALIGHSTGAVTVSYLQGVDPRIEVAVALQAAPVEFPVPQGEDDHVGEPDGSAVEEQRGRLGGDGILAVDDVGDELFRRPHIGQGDQGDQRHAGVAQHDRLAVDAARIGDDQRGREQPLESRQQPGGLHGEPARYENGCSAIAEAVARLTCQRGSPWVTRRQAGTASLPTCLGRLRSSPGTDCSSLASRSHRASMPCPPSEFLPSAGWP